MLAAAGLAAAVGIGVSAYSPSLALPASASALIDKILFTDCYSWVNRVCR